MAAGYRRHVARLLAGLVVFAVIYLALLVGCVALVVVAVVWALREPALWPVAIVIALVSGPQAVFLLLGLLRRPTPSGPTTRIDASGHVRLLAIIEGLARESGARVPRHVTLSAGVNAAMVAGVGHRELVVGLGLINVLTVRELEAVLAHEFGHIGQSSMRVGQWTQRLTLLLRQLVLGRSRLDVRITRAHGSRSLVVRALASMTAVGVHGLRRLLGALLGPLSRLAQAFSRELEFDADRHAVALRGSDLLVSALWKAQRGALAMNAALARLVALARHGIVSEDVYAHQHARLDELDAKLAAAGDPMSAALRRPYQPGPQLHFPPGETPAEVMWYAHPSYREREANAKRDYAERGDTDADVSAWSLLDAPEQLRRDMSALIYEELAGGAGTQQPRPAAEVEDRIADELAEREQGAHYHGFYDNRLVDPGDVDDVADLDDLDDLDGGPEVEALAAAASAWRGESLAAFMAKWHELDARLDRLRAIATGRLQVASHEAARVADDLREAEAARAQAIVAAHGGDRAVFRHLWAISGPEARLELRARYRFLTFVQQAIGTLNVHHGAVGRLSATIDVRHYELARDAPAELLAVVDALQHDLAALLGEAAAITVPPLRNIDDGRTLAELLTRRPTIEPLDHDGELGPWLRELMGQVGEVHQRLRTLHYKNLGALLSLQEKLVAR